MEAKPMSKKVLYTACTIAVTVGMLVIKGAATVINTTVAVLLDGDN